MQDGRLAHQVPAFLLAITIDHTANLSITASKTMTADSGYLVPIQL